ncbi:MAG: DEAD/DEAH box helicase, partial [Cyanobacteria bacterium P01_F01_bin.4]
MSEVSTISRFDELALADPILKAIEQVGYESPSPIQAESIPPLLEGRDLLGQAQTGTGKTAAFALPLLSRLDLNVRKPQLLVLTPTRELALQVAEAVQTYARFLKGFHIIPIYGGQSMGMQLRQLNRGAHTVVGTPGRILDHLRRKTLDLSQLSAVVLDEADEMLRMGFLEDVETILKQTPEQRQVALFSATMSKPIKQIAQRYLQDPVEVRIKSKTATVSTITQRYWEVAGLHKLDALTRILEVEDFEAMLVFVRTKNATAELTEKLEARGYSCAMLSGDIKQVQREKTVDRLKNGSLDIVVATDVAARGLDVDRITHVVNYDVPYDTETYVHRIGRTGRAGRTGNAILFVTPREKRMLRAIERATRQPIEAMQVPSRADIVDRRVAQFKQLM